jgi:hypothetical protein
VGDVTVDVDDHEDDPSSPTIMPRGFRRSRRRSARPRRVITRVGAGPGVLVHP